MRRFKSNARKWKHSPHGRIWQRQRWQRMEAACDAWGAAALYDMQTMLADNDSPLLLELRRATRIAADSMRPHPRAPLRRWSKRSWRKFVREAKREAAMRVIGQIWRDQENMLVALPPAEIAR